LVVNAPDTAKITDPTDDRLVNVETPSLPGKFDILQADWHGPPYPERNDFAQMMAPVDIVLCNSDKARELMVRARDYRRYVASQRAGAYLQVAVNHRVGEDAVGERRARAVETARTAFEIEARVMRPEFDPRELAAKLFRFATIAHAARIVAEWTMGNDRNALLVAASALDSAWVLWLEDTDQAMTCVRGIAEQTARARCWRLKPAAAAKLESTSSPSQPMDRKSRLATAVRPDTSTWRIRAHHQPLEVERSPPNPDRPQRRQRSPGGYCARFNPQLSRLHARR
jgi:hypothetical protein